MVPGIPNTYFLTPVNKMAVQKVNPKTQKEIDKPIMVLFNPQSYKLSTVTIEDGNSKGHGRRGRKQVPKCAAPLEMLDIDFFLDTFSAGAEAAGISEPLTKLKFAGNSLLPSLGKQLDVRDYVNKIYELSKIDPELHEPPGVVLKWNSLFFGGVMKTCSAEFVKFNELGMPVRATVHCTLIGMSMKKKSFFSPDRSKFHQVMKGETLNTLSSIAYDDPGDWRLIAEANGISNPRLLRTGDVLHMPAKVN